MNKDIEISQLEELEHETLRQLEMIREMKEQQLKKDNDNISSDEDINEKEFQDVRYESGSRYTSNYGIKEKEPNLQKSKTLLGSNGRFKGMIPLSSDDQRKLELTQERIKTEQRMIQKSKKDAKESTNSLISRLQLRKQFLENKRQAEATNRSNFIESRRMAFELPVEFKEVRLKVDTTLPEKNDPSLIIKPLNYNKHKDPAYDKYSHKLLSYRFIEKCLMDKIMKEIQPLTLSQFVTHCCPPNYHPPPYANFAIIGIVSQKSDIMISSNSKKYRRVIITDFNIDIMLLIWDKALNKYQDIALGAVIAVLNPQINSYSTTNGKFNAHGSQTAFNLKIENDINNLLVYGRFRYFGTCGDINRGQSCTTVIDRSKGRYCSYHFEKRYKKSTSGRMDLTGSYYSFGAKDKQGNESVLYESKNRLDQIGQDQHYGNSTTNVTKRVPIQKSTQKPTVLPNYDDPSTKNNMLEPHQRNEALFSSSKASLAFYNEKVTNKGAIKRQTEQHKLDKKIMRDRAKKDYEANIKMKEASEAELHKRAHAARKRDIVSTLSNIAGTTEKDLSQTREAKRKRVNEWKQNIENLSKLKNRRLVKDGNGFKMEFDQKDVEIGDNESNSDEDLSHFEMFKKKFKSK